MKPILIYTTYPAPYRVAVIDGIINKFGGDIFYERLGGDARNAAWFNNNEAKSLDCPETRKEFKKCLKEIKKYGLVVILEYTDAAAIKLILKCKLKKVPYVINCDGQILIKHGNPLKEIAKKFLIHGAAGYLAGSNAAKEYFLKYGAKEEKIYLHRFASLYKKDLLSDLPSDKEKKDLRKKLSLPTDGKICIAVGRYIPLKRYDLLLKKWQNQSKDNYLLLVGDGPEEENYKNIISELNLKNVILEGFHKYEELLDYYKAADLFVHPTSYDVWGLVINEAMSMGLPVVSSDTCVAAVELIKDGVNGYKTDFADGDVFMDRVNEILSGDDLRAEMGKNALETIKPFYVENMVDAQVKNIEKIISDNAK